MVCLASSRGLASLPPHARPRRGYVLSAAVKRNWICLRLGLRKQRGEGTAPLLIHTEARKLALLGPSLLAPRSSKGGPSPGQVPRDEDGEGEEAARGDQGCSLHSCPWRALSRLFLLCVDLEAEVLVQLPPRLGAEND